jgi:hypothetical protein
MESNELSGELSGLKISILFSPLYPNSIDFLEPNNPIDLFAVLS